MSGPVKRSDYDSAVGTITAQPKGVSTQVLRDAIIEYDRTEAARMKLFEDIVNDKEFAEWEAVERAALEKVQQAFWEVTKRFNGRSACAMVNIEFMRRMSYNETL